MNTIPVVKWADAVENVAKRLSVEYSTGEVDPAVADALRKMFNTMNRMIMDHHNAAMLKRWEAAVRAL